MEDYLIYTLVGGAIGLISGIACLVVARIKDQQNYIIQKATPLPLALVNVRDDVWLAGVAECDAPLAGPHFGASCLHYEYKLEERVTRTTTDSKGNTRTTRSWKTRERDSRSTQFRLRDAEDTININGADAEFRHLTKRVERIGDWRHTLEYFAFPGGVNAVGSIGEDKAQLEKYANIPLVVTSLDRKKFVEDAEKKEKWLRGGGFFLLWAGLTALFYGLFDWRSIPVATEAQFSPKTLGLAVLPSSIILILYWTIYKYNTFVTYRLRIDNAWRQVDVDLAMRYQLIPQLVSVVKGYMTHEASLLEDLTRLRGEATAGGRDEKLKVEGQMADSVDKTIARIEDYPDLKAQPMTAKLVREMTAIEEKIAHGRTIYNEAVREFNDTVMTMPAVLLAKPCGFKPGSFFSIPESEKQAVSVDTTG